jgi:hypothetical protein
VAWIGALRHIAHLGEQKTLGKKSLYNTLPWGPCCCRNCATSQGHPHQSPPKAMCHRTHPYKLIGPPYARQLTSTRRYPFADSCCRFSVVFGQACQPASFLFPCISASWRLPPRRPLSKCGIAHPQTPNHWPRCRQRLKSTTNSTDTSSTRRHVLDLGIPSTPWRHAANPGPRQQPLLIPLLRGEGS